MPKSKSQKEAANENRSVTIGMYMPELDDEQLQRFKAFNPTHREKIETCLSYLRSCDFLKNKTDYNFVLNREDQAGTLLSTLKILNKSGLLNEFIYHLLKTSMIPYAAAFKNNLDVLFNSYGLSQIQNDDTIEALIDTSLAFKTIGEANRFTIALEKLARANIFDGNVSLCLIALKQSCANIESLCSEALRLKDAGGNHRLNALLFYAYCEPDKPRFLANLMGLEDDGHLPRLNDLICELKVLSDSSNAGFEFAEKLLALHTMKKNFYARAPVPDPIPIPGTQFVVHRLSHLKVPLTPPLTPVDDRPLAKRTLSLDSMTEEQDPPQMQRRGSNGNTREASRRATSSSSKNQIGHYSTSTQRSCRR